MKMKFNLLNLIPVLLLTALSGSGIAFPVSVLAQTLPESESSSPTDSEPGTQEIERYLRWQQSFGSYGKPGSSGTGSAGSRGDCLNPNTPLTVLIPDLTPEMTSENYPRLMGDPTDKNDNKTILLGKTVDGYPTFWFYVPYETSSAINATFMLLEEDQMPVLEEPILIPLSGTPGLVSVTLPETAKELEIGGIYHWFFEVECDADDPSKNPREDGWVERVAPIPSIEPDDYIAYADNGIWYNALTPLVRMRQQNPQNPTLQQDWEDLLKAVGLESLTDVAISDCCTDLESANGL